MTYCVYIMLYISYPKHLNVVGVIEIISRTNKIIEIIKLEIVILDVL